MKHTKKNRIWTLILLAVWLTAVAAVIYFSVHGDAAALQL